MGLLITYFCLSIGISFICSVMEAVMLSISMSFIETKEKEKPGSTKLLKKFKNNIDRPISAILSLNTVAHTIGAAGVGAEATKIWGNEVFGIVSAILTVSILVFSEIIPKVIGATYWKTLAMFSTRVVQFMIYITYPLVYISELITKLLFKKKPTLTTSREEISVMAEMGQKEGILKEKENNVIQNLINLNNADVKDAMTPRSVMVAADENLTLNEFVKIKKFNSFTRIPIYTDTLDDISGYILRPQVYEHIINGRGDMKLSKIRREFIVVYNNLPLSTLWERLLIRKEHIALVTDQYGGVDGLISMEDIIESILGLEIIDERDSFADMQQLARDKWEEKKKGIDLIDE